MFSRPKAVGSNQASKYINNAYNSLMALTVFEGFPLFFILHSGILYFSCVILSGVTGLPELYSMPNTVMSSKIAIEQDVAIILGKKRTSSLDEFSWFLMMESWKCKVMPIYEKLRSGLVLATAISVTGDIHYWRHPYWSQCQMLFCSFLFRCGFRCVFFMTSASLLHNGVSIEHLYQRSFPQ